MFLRHSKTLFFFGSPITYLNDLLILIIKSLLKDEYPWESIELERSLNAWDRIKSNVTTISSFAIFKRLRKYLW